MLSVDLENLLMFDPIKEYPESELRILKENERVRVSSFTLDRRELAATYKSTDIAEPTDYADIYINIFS